MGTGLRRCGPSRVPAGLQESLGSLSEDAGTPQDSAARFDIRAAALSAPTDTDSGRLAPLGLVVLCVASTRRFRCRRRADAVSASGAGSARLVEPTDFVPLPLATALRVVLTFGS